jgi:hypothetical protein
MNGFFRTAAKTLALAAVALAPLAASAEVSVVKVINFSCQYCRASEAMDAPIRRAVEASGGRMVYATMPADETSDGSRELVYYAIRAAMPDKEPQIRASLYKGAQELGYPLATAQQTVEWLTTDLTDLKTDWTLYLQANTNPSAKAAFDRAIRLTLKAGVQVLPSYVIVKNGELVRTLDVDSAGGSYSALREAVVGAIEKANQANPQKPN